MQAVKEYEADCTKCRNRPNSIVYMMIEFVSLQRADVLKGKKRDGILHVPNHTLAPTASKFCWGQG